jgi:hypothetical protein
MGLLAPSPCRLTAASPPPSSPPMILSYLSNEVGKGIHGVAGPLRLPLNGGVPPALVPAHDLVIPVR